MSNKGDISKRQPLAEKLVRMHSAEHILTAVMRRLFASGSVPSPGNLEMHLGEVHLGEKKSKCDYTVSSALTPQEIEKIERVVNAEIEKDHQITTETLPIEEAETIYDLWKVPPDTATIRIVKIGNIDTTPCSGEHVSHTNQIGHFRVKSYTMREENVVRIRFGLEDIPHDSVRTGRMPIAKQDRRSKRIHHEEHEGHEEWNSMSCRRG